MASVRQTRQVIMVGAVLQTLFESPAMVSKTDLGEMVLSSDSSAWSGACTAFLNQGDHQHTDRLARAVQRHGKIGAQPARHELRNGARMRWIVGTKTGRRCVKSLAGNARLHPEAIAEKLVAVPIRHAEKN